MLQLARHETCSNALIEGINCGLPVIYLDSGANREIAERYGVPYEEDFDTALKLLLPRYASIVASIEDNPYRMATTVETYLDVFKRALA